MTTVLDAPVDPTTTEDDAPLLWPDTPAASYELVPGGERMVTDALVLLVVVLVVVLGLPQVAGQVRTGDLGFEAAFFPVLGAAFTWLAWLRLAEWRDGR